MHTHRFWKISAITGVTVALIASVSLLSLAGGAGRVTAQSPDNALLNTITVTGSGEASGTPDVAYLSLGVEAIDADLSAAVTQADETMTAVVDAVQAAGIAPEDIQTVNYSVWSDSSGPNGQSTGQLTYHLSNIVSITVRDTEAVQAVLNAALDAGANSIQNLSFGIQDSASLEQDARLQALDDAHQRASQIAEALGATLGDALIVVEGGSSFPGPRFDAAAIGIGGGGGIQQGQLSVSMQLQVTYALVR